MFRLASDEMHAAEQPEPERQGKGASECSQHNGDRGQITLVVHIAGHDKACDCGG